MGSEPPVPTQRALATPEALEEHCAEHVGAPRIEQPAPGVFVARGYDLANTVVVQTDAGRVVIDAGMSPTRASQVRSAMDEVTKGPVLAVVFTHSHIDHVGGAASWVDEGTEIWATEAFSTHFFKQYGVFLSAEASRGNRQFGTDVSDANLPCSSIGRTVDIRAALESGARLPTKTFSGSKTLVFGGVTIELVEAHGETDDQLFVFLPETGVLLPGDNIYAAFPNLYTIRGTRPRPTDAWIASLDAMRARQARLLIPSHTEPTEGVQAVQERLMHYRDGIQWVRDGVVRAANQGTPIDQIAAEVGLPPHLANEPDLAELYGQVDWSARAIYSNELGWFDGRAGALYPLPPSDRAPRMIAAMGGPDTVRQAARSSDDPRWTIELLELLEQSGETDLNEDFATAYEALAETIANTNGRAYLLVAARERRQGEVRGIGTPILADDFVRDLPIEQIFENTQVRLRPAAAIDVHETVVIAFTDHDPVNLTVRHGVLEVIWGPPLPGTPEPLATATISTLDWKELALDRRSPVAAIADGTLSIEGSAVGFKNFMDRFEQGLAKPSPTLP